MRCKLSIKSLVSWDARYPFHSSTLLCALLTYTPVVPPLRLKVSASALANNIFGIGDFVFRRFLLVYRKAFRYATFTCSNIYLYFDLKPNLRITHEYEWLPAVEAALTIWRAQQALQSEVIFFNVFAIAFVLLLFCCF